MDVDQGGLWDGRHDVVTQLEHLVRVIVEIGSGLDLSVTLRRIVHAAMELTEARYGASTARRPAGSPNSTSVKSCGSMTWPPCSMGCLGLRTPRCAR
jgi:hypothetical protein